MLAETPTRAGYDVGRDQVARLMRTEGIEGARRTKRVRTTRPAEGTPRHPDLVRRDFHRRRPEPTVGHRPDVRADLGRDRVVCFIIDAYSRMIVGWRVTSHMRTEMLLDALEMALCSHGTQLTGLRCHSDAGQFTSVRYGERLADIGSVPSIGTVGDSFDNAVAETVTG